MESIELRLLIKESCKEHETLYGHIVSSINDLLLSMGTDISLKTANSIIDDLKLSYEGKKYMSDCLLSLSENIIDDAVDDLTKGDLCNGGLNLFIAGLCFAKFETESADLEEVDAYKILNKYCHDLREMLGKED